MEAILNRDEKVKWAGISRLLCFLSWFCFSALGGAWAEETGESFETVWNGLKLNYQMLTEEVRSLQSNLQATQNELQKLQALNLEQLNELQKLGKLSKVLELDLRESREASEELTRSLSRANASLSEATNSAQKAVRRNKWMIIGFGTGGLVLGGALGLVLGLTLLG